MSILSTPPRNGRSMPLNSFLYLESRHTSSHQKITSRMVTNHHLLKFGLISFNRATLLIANLSSYAGLVYEKHIFHHTEIVRLAALAG
jgi:hypothetical protein